jgi:hypothetical protein
MRVSHAVTAVFDDPNLLSYAGLAPVLHLSRTGRSAALVGEHVQFGRCQAG